MNNTKKFLVLLVAPVLFFSFSIKQVAVNFSGEWKLNESKSDMGQFANIVPRKIKITQTNDSITIAKTALSFQGDEYTVSETLSFDGKETKSSVPPGNSTRTASAKWSDDGKTLTVPFTFMLDFNGQTTEIKGSETWSLSDDGKNLTLQSSSSSSFGDNAFKGFYDK